MKKGLVVLLVLLTAACLFASDFTVGANVGFATGGTAKLKTESKTYGDKEKITYSGLALGITGSYKIDANYSIDADCDFVFPNKLSCTSVEDDTSSELEWTRKAFKKQFGKANFFAFKMRAGVGYALPVDSVFDFKVGGGLAFNTASFKGKSSNDALSSFGIGIYGFGQALYPVAKNISLIGSANLEISLYGKTKYASGLMFFPSCSISVGAVYNI